jgi:hypothetical protein
LLAITLAIVPDDFPIPMTFAVFAIFAVGVAFTVRIAHQSKHRPWTIPEETITVQVDAKWLRRAKSPIIMMPIAALTGVSVTFAPLYLLYCGQFDEFGIVEWIGVPICFLIIYLVPGFYMSLASEVLGQLVKQQESSTTSQ